MVDFKNLVAMRLFGQDEAKQKRKEEVQNLQAQQASEWVKAERDERDREFSRNLELYKAQAQIDKDMGRGRSLISADPRLEQAANLGTGMAEVGQKRAREARQSELTDAKVKFDRSLQSQTHGLDLDLVRDQSRSELDLVKQDDARAHDATESYLEFTRRKALQGDNNAAALYRAYVGANAQKEAAKAKGAQQPIKNASALRKEFMGQKTYKNMTAISEAAAKLKYASPNAAGDLNLIFAYMKLLDPDSVVRESEQASVANAAGVPDRIKITWNKMLQGEKLSSKQRAEFKNEAMKLFAAQKSTYAPLADKFRGLAMEQGVDPDDVVLMSFDGPEDTTAETVTPDNLEDW